MEKKVIKRILALLMIITILSADFFVLGSNLISYAANQIETATSEPNIKFSAYFKNENNEKVNNINQSIKSENLKLFAEIQVENEGYLKDGTIEIQNKNFKLKNDILSTKILSIKENKINLKQINAGETVEIEIGIEPIITDKVPANMILEETVKLVGTYVSSENETGEIIEPVSRQVSVNYQVDTTAQAELQAELITNKVFTENEKTQTIMQLLVKSRLSENQYPVEETTINVDIPIIGEKTPEVKVIAANGRTQISNHTVENGKLTVTLSNERDTAGYVNWYKNGYEEIIVTFIYEGTVITANEEIRANSGVKVYNAENNYMAGAGVRVVEEVNNTVIANQEINTTEMYKGQLYANTEMTYNTTTTLVVTDVNTAKEVTIQEGLDKFILTDETTLDTDAKYVLTEINKQQLVNVLGSEGTITIKNGETELLKTTKVSEISEEKITVNYTKTVGELQIITSKPAAEGIVEIRHTKTMTANGYTRDQIRTVTGIKTIASVEGTSSVQKPTEERVTLNDTISKAELVVLSDGDLSTTEETNLKLGITLITDGTEYDLYKNPEIAIQMPTAVESVTLNTAPTVQNVSEKDTITIETNNFRYDKTTKQIKIKVTGEQTVYPEGALTELYIPLDLNVKTSRLAASEISTLKMMYTNENAIQYYGGVAEVGVVEQDLGIEAPAGIIKYFNLSTNENKTITQDITQNIYPENEGKEVEFEIAIVNNTETDMTDVKILGKLPTTGNEENTMETTLRSITSPNSTIYYTENASATTDIEDTTNGWTTELSANAKLYLIKIDTLAKGSNHIATAKVKLPSKIETGTKSYTQYEVTYTAEGTTKTENSRRILLKGVVELEVELTAQVGQENLRNGDIVKEGEVVKYTATIKNNTNKTFENIQLKANVPEGTVVVEPVELYVYSEDPFYYEEKTDISEINVTIPVLGVGETYTEQYEVRVNMDATTKVQEISNKVTITQNEKTVESEEIKNILQESDIRVTIKRDDDETAKLVSGGNANHRILIENLSDKAIKDVKIEIVSNDYSVTKIENNTTKQEVYKTNEVVIDKIPANGNIEFIMEGIIANDVETLNMHVKANYSNELYKSNVITEKLLNIKTEISLTSPQDNKTVKQGETIEYNITLKNIGDLIDGGIRIKDTISEYLKVMEVYENGTLYIQTTNKDDEETYVENIVNEVFYTTAKETKANETIELKIVAKVKEIPISLDGEIIVNKAEVSVLDVNSGTSNEVKHTLDCGQKNLITGLSWLDEDADGIKDNNEATLSGITVKLYNTYTKSFLNDNSGNILKTQTGTNGEYQFIQIPNGSYIIVFEHGMEKYETTTNQADSKAGLYEITVNGEKQLVSGIKLDNIQDIIISNANLGLKEKGATPPEDNNQNNPENPEISGDKKEISGLAWLDSNRNGQKDDNEKTLEGIKVKLYDTSTQNYLNTTTNATGEYKFTNINQGAYIVIFEYDTEEYEPTTYFADGVDTTKNSKVVLKKININGQETITAVTDTINVKENVSNINIGLREKLTFDLELNKYISRVVVQNSKGTKSYDYENSTFAKVEIHRKQINGSNVVLEYTIKVKNNGEVTGYAKNIVDYLPSGLTFSSELNKDWYLSGNYLYTKSLENIEIKPGEEKEIKLILTKTMTNDNVGLINNRAEIYQDYNEYGIADTDSKVNNQIQDEDDLGSADVIVLVSTGGGNVAAYISLLIVNMILIGIAIRLMVKNKIIKISRKRGRG